MIPWVLLDTVQIPYNGGTLRLHRRDDEFSIRVDSCELMNSRSHGSEELLAELACERIRQRPQPRILIGGLGMGFTLSAALNTCEANATVLVAELICLECPANRCPDKGYRGYGRYVGLGILAYNLHKIGNRSLNGIEKNLQHSTGRRCAMSGPVFFSAMWRCCLKMTPSCLMLFCWMLITDRMVLPMPEMIGSTVETASKPPASRYAPRVFWPFGPLHKIPFSPNGCNNAGSLWRNTTCGNAGPAAHGTPSGWAQFPNIYFWLTNHTAIGKHSFQMCILILSLKCAYEK